MLFQTRPKVVRKPLRNRSLGVDVMPEDCQDQSRRFSQLDHSPTDADRMALATAQRCEIIPQQAETDEQLIGLWLHGRPATTTANYRADAKRMMTFVGKPLTVTTLADLQAFALKLEAEGLAPGTQHRILSAVKSLFSFACKLGYVRFDVGRALRLPALRNRLSDRILDEEQIARMISLELQPRNKMVLTLLYAAGLRVSELAGLKWWDCVARQSGGQITVEGKGGKVRAVLLPASVWDGLVALRRGAAEDAPVFRSRKRGHLQRAQLLRIVRRAARRAGIAKNVSPHWLRHGHASHALDRGCPIHLVQATLGHASLHSTTRYVHARPTDSSSTYLPV